MGKKAYDLGIEGASVVARGRNSVSYVRFKGKKREIAANAGFLRISSVSAASGREDA